MSLSVGFAGTITPAQVGGLIPRGTRVTVFQEIYTIFLALGTLVGVVVVGYMLYNAYKYRATSGAGEGKVEDRPKLGELPMGGGGGRKLFLSFALSAIIVVSLIAWTYGTLLYVENQGEPASDQVYMTVEVVGHQFFWEFIYPNGHSADTLRIPAGKTVRLEVTSADVFHNFGVPGLRVKVDAIPGQTTDTWIKGDERGTYAAHCYELCGSGHSFMDAEVRVLSESAFQEWYQSTKSNSGNASSVAPPHPGSLTAAVDSEEA